MHSNQTTQPEYCSHGVPSFALCRWCQDGTEPQAPVSVTDREARIDAIRKDWQGKLKA